MKVIKADKEVPKLSIGQKIMVLFILSAVVLMPLSIIVSLVLREQVVFMATFAFYIVVGQFILLTGSVNPINPPFKDWNDTFYRLIH